MILYDFYVVFIWFLYYECKVTDKIWNNNTPQRGFFGGGNVKVCFLGITYHPTARTDLQLRVFGRLLSLRNTPDMKDILSFSTWIYVCFLSVLNGVSQKSKFLTTKDTKNFHKVHKWLIINAYGLVHFVLSSCSSWLKRLLRHPHYFYEYPLLPLNPIEGTLRKWKHLSYQGYFSLFVDYIHCRDCRESPLWDLGVKKN